MLLEYQKEKLQNMQSLLASLNEIDEWISVLIEQEQYLEEADIKSEIARINKQSLFLSNRLMNCATKNISVNCSDADEIHRTYFEIADQFDIDACAYQGNLFVRCPYPPHRFRETFRGYSALLAEKIESVMPYLCNRQANKLVMLINVFDLSCIAGNNKYFYDYDNYDYKNLLDEICRWYTGADSPATTKLIFTSIRADSLKPQTYAIVKKLSEEIDISDQFLRTVLEEVWTKDNPEVIKAAANLSEAENHEAAHFRSRFYGCKEDGP